MERMEKLIELLDERDTTVNGKTGGWCKEHLEYQCHGPRVISKKFGFIKWLVENDKIDYHNKIDYDISLAINRVPKKTTREERLLMMLAIQDEPINYLISMLR